MRTSTSTDGLTVIRRIFDEGFATGSTAVVLLAQIGVLERLV